MAQYIQIAKRWWWLVVIMGALGAATGYVIAQRQPRVYEARTTLLVAAGAPSPEVAERLIPDSRSSLVKTYRELLLKRPVLEQVIAELGLETIPEELAERMAIKDVRDTQIIVLSARDSDPQRAAAIANATVAAFNRQAGTLLANPYATGRGGLNVVEPASPPIRAISSGPLRMIAIVTLVALLLAGALVFAIEFFDTRVRSEIDIAQLTGLPTIIAMGFLEGRKPHQRLVTRTRPASHSAEVYRMLRLVLESDPAARPIRTLIVTSPDAGEGKSLTAANLAIALAQTGLRVILVDANLRRPMIHQLFEQQNDRGLTTVMRPDGVGDPYLQTVESGVENLRLLLSGPKPQLGLLSAARLLTPGRLLTLTRALQPHADVLVFDSPPVLEVIETALLARSCDGSLLVVEAGRTQADKLLRARQALARTKVDLLGVVLNQAERPAVGMLGAPEPQQTLLRAPAAPGYGPALPYSPLDGAKPLPVLGEAGPPARLGPPGAPERWR
ncbi:MAG: polysaccharide biosynthesis tyrosine autokinase [Oscillochloridaceae bacterium]|nr:polysaccharide biosynthesis tyrosine autokinase [Chloroflexaceae bacterium]MDW8388733.1 polysaccharide biosynthesis tyrosine autokinase [Oscillochloridaceae bacterium]